MELKITDLAATQISGVRVALPASYETGVYREDYFAWTAMPLVTPFHTGEVMMGILEGWHHTPCFGQVEYHADKECFYFMSGTALMYFVDIRDGKPVLESGQLVRIPAGAELEIEAGKGHFIAVAEDDHFRALVTSPVQQAPRLPLPETVCGV